MSNNFNLQLQSDKTSINIDSTISSPHNFDERVCYELSYFRDLLKNLRKLDDNIILKLNKSNTKNETSCYLVFEELSKAYNNRDMIILKCSELVEKKVKGLREEALKTPNDSVVKSHLYSEEAKLRWIKNEASVESIIRQRSIKVFLDRCRNFDKEKFNF